MTMKRILGVIGLVTTLVTVSSARADHAEELAAQTLYDKALELMKAGKPAAACPLLAESQRLDPAAGTQYHLAECFEKTGRTEAAWKLYTEVAEASKKAGRKDREEQAREHADAMWNLLPRLAITISPEVAKEDALSVMRDGKVVPPEEWNQERPVKPGQHTVEVHATGKKPWGGTVTARAGATEKVRIPGLESVVAAIAPTTPDGTLPMSNGADEVPLEKPNKGVVIAGAALTALGLGIGGASMAASFGKASDLDAALIVHPCVRDSGHCTSKEVTDAEASRRALGSASAWSFIAAGLLGAATVTYVLFPRSSKVGNGTTAAFSAGLEGLGVTVARAW
jgi:hypothetical protein